MGFDLPLTGPRQVVGLLGGSFDPAHEGHVKITLEALKRFHLDQVWWLVSPGNPLKQRGPALLADRMEQARKVMQHPGVHISDFEARIGTRYTAQTLQALDQAVHGARFVWLMGADNLVQFHQWQDWRGIMERVPVGVLARPGDRLKARNSVAARAFKAHRLPESQAPLLGRMSAPGWCFVNIPMSAASSTSIRQRNGDRTLV